MSGFQDRLSTALVDRYALERELGRGGMATVYLARDLKHRRFVALKVLHPELAAALGPERFLREIEVTAKLEHPHILPVLDSGDVGGLLWYTMPYVEGESLRDRLRREIQLSVAEAVRIAREVADGLQYAHDHGVVHRDIKPENILLAHGHARVVDFGVAQALQSAGGDRLTGTGLAIGTPLYMSPEQASGGDLDGRSDLYSLGCVLYEMLAGEPPFTGRTPQAIIAKRLSDVVPPIRTVRPSVPPGVERVLTKALARVPADRFATIGEFAARLHSTERAPRSHQLQVPQWPAWRRLRHVAGLLFAGLVVMTSGYMALRALGIAPPGTLLGTGVLKERERLILADFGTRQVDSALGGVLTEAIRIDLAQSPVVTLVTSVQVAEALRRMQKTPMARLDPALAREVAVREGIKAVVTGEIAKVGSQYVLSAHLVSARDGEVLTAHRVTASDSTALIAGVDRLSSRLRARIGESVRSIGREPPLERVTTASLPALRQYTRAVRAGDHEGDHLKAMALLEEAVRLDSGFAMAYRTLGMYARNRYQADRMIQAYSAAVARRDRLTERELHFTLGDYYSIVTFEPRKAVAAYEALLENHPHEREALNNLAIVYRELRQHRKAEPLLHRALAVDSLYMPAHANLVLFQTELAKWPEARASYERAIRQLPEVPQVWLAGIPLAEQHGDYTTAEARTHAFMKRFGADPYWRAIASKELATFAAVRGKLRDAERYLRDAMAAFHQASAPDLYHAQAIWLASVLATVGGEPSLGLREVERALARYPLDSLKPMDRPYLGLAQINALIGRADRARAFVLEYERMVDPRYRHPGGAAVELARGRVALAERRWQDAIAKFREVVNWGGDPAVGMPELGRAYDLAGETDSAIALYERYLGTPDAGRSGTDAIELPRVYHRLGELYEERSERDKAREYYSRFIQLWQDCDPKLRPRVAEVRQRLAALSGEPRR